MPGISPEAKARQDIDSMLSAAGWVVQDRSEVNLSAARGVAVREVSLKRGHGETDYLLFADARAIGTVEAKPEGWTLRGVEEQSGKYSAGLPADFPAWHDPLPFCYESTSVETRFTNKLDPEPRSREVFSFHHPETLIAWVRESAQLRHRLLHLPPLITNHLWPAQARAISGVEQSLAQNHPRSLAQGATGSGKTFIAVNTCYRLVKFANARRILFLVDRGNLGRQAFKEFQQFVTPDDGRKFTELYNVQHLQSNQLDPVSRVCITTIQRLYSMLKGEAEMPPDLDEKSGFEVAEGFFKEPVPVAYNPAIPIETFDFIIVDECHRSIYNLWRQVLEYFDAFLIGLTATPSKETFGYFHQNLVTEYSHEQAVADGVNVNYDVYRIRTEITEQGSKVEAGFFIDKRHRQTRKVRWEQLADDLDYDAGQLDRAVVATDQIRTVIRAFRDKLFTEIFPGRTDVPKTLIYAKDDSHADDIVEIVRQEFGKGNDFCQKITYRTGFLRHTEKVTNPDGIEVDKVTWEKVSNLTPDQVIAALRNSYNPRIVVTVDMIATGTDIKPLEIVLFMRSVQSRTFFEQMKGRGVRVISDTDFQSVTPDARAKTHFVIVDAVGVCERDKTDSRPLERKPSVSFEKLLTAVAFGRCQEDLVTSVAARLARLDRHLEPKEQAEVQQLAKGVPLSAITHQILDALDPDRAIAAAKDQFKTAQPTREQIKQAGKQLVEAAVAPIATNPALRNRLIELQREKEQIIDTISKDRVIAAGFDANALDAARGLVKSFEQFITEHKDEITALQILYSRPHRARLTFNQVKELAAAIEKPPRRWTTDALWAAYEKLGKTVARADVSATKALKATQNPGEGRTPHSAFRTPHSNRLLTDLVSLVRLALHEEEALTPFADTVSQRFSDWLAQQSALGRAFTPDQLAWLERIRDHITTSLSIDPDDFDYAPFNQQGGLGKAHQLFGEQLPTLLNELNEVLAV